MKTLLIIAIALISFHGIAQERKERPNREARHAMMKDLTPEEAAELRTKKMTLHLDLNADQQKKIFALNLENAKMRQSIMKAHKAQKEAGNMQKPSKEAMLKRQNNKLDHQIAMKAKMKNILDENQYAKWEKGLERMAANKNFKKKEGYKNRI